MDHVYHRFTKDDLFHTTIHAQPQTIAESGSTGWTGNTLSLYGGVRSRLDCGKNKIPVDPDASNSIQIYPIDEVDTHSIDKVIGIPGEYPATGSINLVCCLSASLNDIKVYSPTTSVTDIHWFDEHWAPINVLSDWYHKNRYSHYPALDMLPVTMTLYHIPEMFYGRQIATGSISIWTQAWKTNKSMHAASGTRYYVDDGYGRIWDVPSGSSWQSGTAIAGYVFCSEGLIVFTNPNPLWHTQFFSASYDGGYDPSSHLEFKGSTIMQSFVMMCRLPQAAANASNNPTYYFETTGSNSEKERWARYPTIGSLGENRTYITSIGMYNEERQLVAVAKIAQPIRKRESDNIDIRLRFDI